MAEVTTALLRFMAEFVMNKNTRLAFDSSSPNGILLFREVSKVTCLYITCYQMSTRHCCAFSYHRAAIMCHYCMNCYPANIQTYMSCDNEQ